MKETIIQIMQAQMDKCTNEQFWAVASMTAVDAFFVTQKSDLAPIHPAVTLTALGFATTYGILFVIQRHYAYYRLHNSRAELLKDEPHAPDFMKERAQPRRFQELSGILFYVAWLVAGFLLCGSVV